MGTHDRPAPRKRQTHPPFRRVVGIDYSGAGAPDAPLPGLQAYAAEVGRAPLRVAGPGRRHWSRAALAAWLRAVLDPQIQAAGPGPTLVGIDHGFSFPDAWFDAHGVPRTWPAAVEDFCAHWPTREHSVESVRRGGVGSAPRRLGDARWRRRAEVRTGRAKSVFHFDVPGSVAKSTHAGIPWLHWLRGQLGAAVHFWPYDGWRVPPGRSVIAEAYPSLWNARHPRDRRSPDEHDAWCVAVELEAAVRSGAIAGWFEPALDAAERGLAAHEGWILGVN